ncbi:TPA: DUF1033 family protein [Streptococcus suis]|uniref:DNA binding protein n=1 Tax=Streptococcus suis TaxID=1307 RepID=A0A0M9FDW8_STRSU|nr:DUF1033 family protein [Streptococcus suis]AZR98235.1 superoxide dismutase [Streptococcus suis]KPA62525.1 superoxide dismutase [Streptococcus suis]NQG60099.1 DUF1033 family protein [Streptococcus suis]NQH17841.1 DUF1033 family protein [Streptococcus suis]NQJ48580.1 DUF1033 family protein [Streptococcus suis]
MYQVIKMYGDFEPWWFLDGWEEDIVSKKTYERYEDAQKAFQKEWVRLSESFPNKKCKNGTMVAFWDESDQHWCEECDEYLQRYHSLMLVESKEVLPQGLRKREGSCRVRPCQLRNTEKLG